MTALEEFCGRLRAVRRQRRLSQPYIGDALGVSAVAVSYWELGRARPSDSNLREWAASLGVEVPEGVAGWTVPECGTRPAYKRHLARGETTDAACRAANTADYHLRKGAS